MSGSGRARSEPSRRVGPERVGLEPPPSPTGNTGDGCTSTPVTTGLIEVGIHGLDGTTRLNASEVLSICDEHLGEFTRAEHGTKLYAVLWRGPHGSQVEADPRRGSSDHCRVSLPGEMMDRLDVPAIVALGTALELNPTRIDPYADGAPFHPDAIAEAWRQDLTRTKVHRSARSFSRLEDGVGDVSVYIGSPTADARMRVYNRRGPTRVELQLRRDKARTFWRELCSRSVEELPELVLGAFDGFVSFCAPIAEDSNRSRWTRLPLWDAFLCGAARVRLAVSRLPLSLERLAGHVWRQAGALATWLEAEHLQGRSMAHAIAGLVTQGRERRSSLHSALLAGVRATQSP